MAWTSAFRITVSDAQDSSDDWLRIEQPEWKEPSINGFSAWLDSTGQKRTMYNIFDLLDEYQSFCNNSGELEVEIEVHLSRPDLPYSIFAHHGTLGGKSRHTKSHTKIVPVMMESSYDLDVVAIAGGATWEGPVINADGQVIAPPPIRLSTGDFSWDEPVIGSLRISYKESHDAYILTIPSRASGDYDPEATETAYETTVVAQYAGGIEVHEVDIPDSSGTCQGGASVSVKGKDNEEDGDGEDEDCVRLVLEVNPCSNDELARYTESMPCPDDTED